MAKIYWRTIKRGTRTLAECPENLHDEIKALAKAEVAAGELSEGKYKRYIGEDYIA